MPRNSKELLNFLFSESQDEADHDNNGEGVDTNIDELQKELENAEEFQNLEDVMSTDKAILEPHLKPLIAKLKEIGIEGASERVENCGCHFILKTPDQAVHHQDLAILQDFQKANALIDSGFIPLNGESDQDDNGMMRYHVVIIK